MKRAPRVLGVYREAQNSPDREVDDALILRSVLEKLSGLRAAMTLMSPQEFDRADLSGYDLILPMCEAYPRLMRLKRLEAETGVLVVNAPAAILGTYRASLLASFARCPGLSYPETEVRRTSQAAPPPAFASLGPSWVKRGDVHSAGPGDVVYARGWDEVDAARRDFERREIAEMAIQRHVDGDVVKFYGVGPGRWLTWLYHDRPAPRRWAFEPEDLAAQARRAAEAVGLEVFGGDAIVTENGRVVVVDLNSWPSFSRVRADAAAHIARHLGERLRAAAAARA